MVLLSILQLPLRLGFSAQRGYFLQLSSSQNQPLPELPSDCLQVVRLSFSVGHILIPHVKLYPLQAAKDSHFHDGRSCSSLWSYLNWIPLKRFVLDKNESAASRVCEWNVSSVLHVWEFCKLVIICCNVLSAHSGWFWILLRKFESILAAYTSLLKRCHLFIAEYFSPRLDLICSR